MHFDYSSEHVEFKAALREFLDGLVPLTSIPRLVEEERSSTAPGWTEAAEQMGLTGLEVPEEFGGSGADTASVIIAMTELGAAMVPGPLAPTLGLAVPLLIALPECEERSALLTGIASGERVPGIDRSLFEPRRTTAAGSPLVDSTGTSVSGTALRVIDDGSATDLVLLGSQAGERTILNVRLDAAGVTRRPLTTLDAARQEVEVLLDGAPAVVLARGADAERALAVGHRRALLFAASEAVGGAERALEIAVQYAKDRQAFGKVIGTFQALKHRLAQAHVENELARTMLMYSTWATTVPAEQSDPTALEQTKLAACDAYLETSRVAVGVLGGTGYTWEHPIQLFFKRATALREQFDRPAELRRSIAAAVIERSKQDEMNSAQLTVVGGGN